MKYCDLTNIQKRVIDAFIQVRPKLASSGTITREEVEAIHAELYEKRKSGGEKIGYPMWLVKGPKVSRGVYVFPAPNAPAATVTILQQSNQKSTNASLEKEDKEFFEELKQYGIMP